MDQSEAASWSAHIQGLLNGNDTEGDVPEAGFAQYANFDLDELMNGNLSKRDHVEIHDASAAVDTAISEDVIAAAPLVVEEPAILQAERNELVQEPGAAVAAIASVPKGSIAITTLAASNDHGTGDNEKEIGVEEAQIAPYSERQQELLGELESLYKNKGKTDFDRIAELSVELSNEGLTPKRVNLAVRPAARSAARAPSAKPPLVATPVVDPSAVRPPLIATPVVDPSAVRAGAIRPAARSAARAPSAKPPLVATPVVDPSAVRPGAPAISTPAHRDPALMASPRAPKGPRMSSLDAHFHQDLEPAEQHINEVAIRSATVIEGPRKKDTEPADALIGSNNGVDADFPMDEDGDLNGDLQPPVIADDGDLKPVAATQLDDDDAVASKNGATSVADRMLPQRGNAQANGNGNTIQGEEAADEEDQTVDDSSDPMISHAINAEQNGFSNNDKNDDSIELPTDNETSLATGAKSSVFAQGDSIAGGGGNDNEADDTEAASANLDAAAKDPVNNENHDPNLNTFCTPKKATQAVEVLSTRMKLRSDKRSPKIPVEASIERSAKRRKQSALKYVDQIHAIKGEKVDDQVVISVQIARDGPFTAIETASDMKKIKELGHSEVLQRVKEDTDRVGHSNQRVNVGAKSNDVDALLPLRPTIFSAQGSHCLIYSLFNAILDSETCILSEEEQALLVSVSDSDGKTNFKDLTNFVNNSSSIPFEFHRIKKDMLLKCEANGSDPTNFMNLEQKERLNVCCKLVAAGEMLIVTIVSPVDNSIDHAVGMYNGLVYDPDAATGGVFKMEEYIRKEMKGIHDARRVVFH